MSKSRLCEILGVEVYERFCLKDLDGIEFAVSPYGYIWAYCDDGTDISINYLSEMINHPEKIIHKPKWTQQDIDDAKAIKRLTPWVHRIGRDVFGAVYLRGDVNGLIDASLFPSLKQNEEIDLDEILKSGEAKERVNPE